jgi:16S rRNA U1498 N3-methylase RsmE
VEHDVLVATLGKLVLRTETAGLATLALVRHLAGELG